MKAIGFIPVRGGSKSIAKKNIRPLAGKPLVLWIVEAAAASEVLDLVVVATDDEAIRAVVERAKIPRVVVTGRDPSNATDTASTESVMLEYAEKEEFDAMVLLQATSPLTTAHDIRGAMDLFEKSQADSLVSGVRQKRFTWKVDGESIGTPLNYDPVARPRRQDFEGFVVENGAIYISRRPGLIENRCRIFGKVAVYEMPEETYLEMDEPNDWTMVETLIESKTALSTATSMKDIRLVLTDVDGVLTDAGMYYGESGEELKKFNTRDGKGFELVRNAGLQTGIVTQENTRIVERRAQKLKVDHLYQGVKDKAAILGEICERAGLAPENIAYVGDDLNDVGILRLVGFAACPADAVLEVKKVVHYVARANGGEGVIREVCELILGGKTLANSTSKVIRFESGK